MKITVKCYASLCYHEPKEPGGHEVKDSSPVREVVSGLGINPEDVNIIFVNGKQADMNTILADGDRLGIFPAIGGG